MRSRLLVALIGIPLLFAAVWYGGLLLSAVVIAVTAVGVWEACRLADGWFAKPSLRFAWLWAGLVIAVAHLSAVDNIRGWILLFAIMFFASLFFIAVLFNREETRRLMTGIGDALERVVRAICGMRLTPRVWLATFLCAAYVAVPMAHVILLREGVGGITMGREWLLFALFATFAVDTGSFAVGRWIGSRPMAPSISPGKTWEGLAGGMVAVAAAALALDAALGLPMTWLEACAVGLAVGVAAVLGDLLESLLKRRAGVKDSGALLGGHGGVLDRMDSLLATIPVTFYAAALIIA